MECLLVHHLEESPAAPAEAPATPAGPPDADLAAEVATLRDAIATRTIIGQATGLLAGQLNLPTPLAWRVMRRLSNETNIKLRDIARALVDAHDGRGTTDPEAARAISAALGPALAAAQDEDDQADEAGVPVP
jgi:hypothetical protein